VNKATIGGETIRASRHLKLITLSATGTDNVDVATARKCGVAVANIRDYCSTSLSQHVFALVLGLTQQITAYNTLVRGGAWQKSRTFALFDYPIRELTGRPVGVKTAVGGWKFMHDMADAIHRRGLELAPDFLVIDGGEGGSGAAPRRSPTTWACRSRRRCRASSMLSLRLD